LAVISEFSLFCKLYCESKQCFKSIRRNIDAGQAKLKYQLEAA